jgi:hypothetical protein
MPRSGLVDIIEVCHRHQVLVSTGGFIEYVTLNTIGTNSWR